MENSIAVCGLECDNCDLYLCDEDEEIASRLLSIFKKREWIDGEITVRKFMQDGKKCLGCRGDRDAHWSENCSILLCCIDDKQLDSCHDCSDFVCERLKTWAEKSERYTHALERLKKLEN